jgi:hypothetical protein
LPVSGNTLDAYLEQGYAEIPGWLSMPAVEATLLLADVQEDLLAPMPVCEIGVWQARYLTLLSFVPATPQRVVGIDPFIHCPDPRAQVENARRNVARYARIPDLVTLIEASSKDVDADAVIAAAGGLCQFVSVDGDHTLGGALHDLRLAQQILAPGGIVAVDDIPNFSCPGVTEAVMRHSLDASCALAPFLVVGNKLFLTQMDYCEFYRQEILRRGERQDAAEWARQVVNYRRHMQSLNIPVMFLGQELLVAA